MCIIVYIVYYKSGEVKAREILSLPVWFLGCLCCTFFLICALVAYGGGRLRADLLVQFSRLTGETVRKIMTLTRQPLEDGMACFHPRAGLL